MRVDATVARDAHHDVVQSNTLGRVHSLHFASTTSIRRGKTPAPGMNQRDGVGVD